MRHFEAGVMPAQGAVDCAADPAASLVQMFVGMVEAGRIKAGQCPALRPVFLKSHGVTYGMLRVRPGLPADLRVGLFAGHEYPAWIRFSSDTLPTANDFTSTLGIGIKLFGVPGKKLFGAPDDPTFDLVLQNMDVFFVNTAKDMCEFTKAGVVDGDYDRYLASHPETARILNDMAKPVGSVLATPYWSGLPFAFGPGRYVKYKLEPTIVVPPPQAPPPDPTYLAADLAADEVALRLCVQFRTDPARMPLDMAMVPWTEEASPPVHLADLVLPRQDVSARGQAAYGENLSWNIWRMTEEHRPEGSIAAARRVVYAASAQMRRDANGVPTGEPVSPKPAQAPPPGVDRVIVRAAIHPAIGVARVGDSRDEYYVGPQVTDPPPSPPGFYRDATGALKRQAAAFRVYGYNAAGDIVGELTADSADIEWTVHPANRKAAWYEFQVALDIPDAAGTSMHRRNPKVPLSERGKLAIDPGPRSIRGKSVSGGAEHAFDTGRFMDTLVPLGEIRTDEVGRLLFLGGRGVSASPSGAPIYDPAHPESFNNAAGWYDDISDGPVTAKVSIDGRAIPVDHAWVVVAPPNYGTDVVGCAAGLSILGTPAHRAFGGNAWAWGRPELEHRDFLADPDGPGWRIDRRALEADLVAAAARAGARLHPVALRRVARSGDGWRADVLGGTALEARWIGDATGRSSRIARRLGARRRRDEKLVAVVGRARPSPAFRFERTLVEATALGWWYAARLPDGAASFMLHTRSDRANHLLACPAAWRAALADARHVPAIFPDPVVEMPLRGFDATGGWLEPSWASGWTACGDAALSFDPLAAQGLLGALTGALEAAGAVDAALGGDLSELHAYAERLADIRRIYRRRLVAQYAQERRWAESPFWRERDGSREPHVGVAEG